jgi:N-acetylneuraminate lyase
MTKNRITGFVAATHTAFHADGSLNLGAIELQAAHLLRNNIHTAFVSGSTGECSSLSFEERRLAGSIKHHCFKPRSVVLPMVF